jgi:hypothetical protein
MTVAETAAGAEREPLRVLFFLRGVQYTRVFENFLRELLDRGHRLHVVLALEKRGFADRTHLFDEFSAKYEGFSWEQLGRREGLWDETAVALRHALDYLRYLEPEFLDAHPLRARAAERAPALVRVALAAPLRRPVGRRVVSSVLGRVEAAVPVPRGLVELVGRESPDVVLVSPLVGLGSIEVDHLRAAQRRGVPTVLPVASWDNLSNKGVLRDRPTTTIVWNPTQVDEAVRFHGVPQEQVAAVGAHSFDHWFDWQPSVSKEGLAERLGLDAERPIILYVGSSNFIAGDETVFVREWLGHLRRDPRLAECAVVLRPHPYNTVGWDALEVEEPGRTVIWPKGGALPDNDEAKAEYFDQLYHAAAIVGINTSALVEASILRKPILTLDDTRFPAQRGTLHFGYIAYDEERGTGVVQAARSWTQHRDHLAAAVQGDSGHVARCDRFVAEFVRPLGREVAAAPAAVDLVEATAAVRVPRAQRPLLAPLLELMTPVVWLLAKLLQPRRTWQTVAKAYRKHRKARARAKAVGAKANRAAATATKPRKPPKPLDQTREAKLPMTVTPEEPLQSWGKPPKPPRTDAATSGVKPAKPPKPPKPPKPGAGVKPAKPPKPPKTGAATAGVKPAKPPKPGAGVKPPKPPKPPKTGAATAGVKPAKPHKAGAGKAGAKPAKHSKPAKKKSLEVRVRRGVGIARKRGRRQWKLARHATYSFYNRRNRSSYASTITKLPSRDELPMLLNARGLLGTGAEIGVKRAAFSDHILKHWKGARFISIDPWLSVDWEEYIDRSNVTQDEFDENYVFTKNRLAKYGNRSEIWRLLSVEAAQRVPRHSMDFVYIDARHDYESVKEDLHAWFDKVRPGGIFAGHDYADGILVQGDFGVKSAVDEFFGERGIPVHITQGPSPVEMFPSWVVLIPETDA